MSRLASLRQQLRQLATLPTRIKGLSRRRQLALAVGLAALGGGAGYAWVQATAASSEQAPAAGDKRRGDRPGGRVQPVKAASVKQGDFEVTVSALGTVTASNTALVKPRVDGQLVKILFREGQPVKAGDVLAEIDPRPFQIQLDQVHGQLLKDQALLSAAQVDLERYRSLLAKDSIAKQQVDTQEALVRQYQGVVEADKAQEANARLQLSFTRITAPAAGRLGLRQVDVGNMLRAGDATGVVTITQTQPINVVFAIPADSLGPLPNRLQQGEALGVELFNRDARQALGSGKLASIDNQIDTSTGTVKLKAEFANRDNSLFPNQFVNVRLKVDERQKALLLPSAAIQRNAQGSFVYRIAAADSTVESVPIKLGPSNGDTVVIEQGLAAGEVVVLDGADRLRPGGKVEVLSVDGQVREDGPGKGDGKGEGRRKRSEGKEGGEAKEGSRADGERRPRQEPR